MGRVIKYCLEKNLKLKDLSIEKLKEYSSYFESDFYNCIQLDSCINSKVTDCGTSKKQVKNKIEEAKRNLNKLEKNLNTLSLRIPRFEKVVSSFW